jgi:hypothetical protein
LGIRANPWDEGWERKERLGVYWCPDGAVLIVKVSVHGPTWPSGEPN